MFDKLLQEAVDFAGWQIEVRRALHKRPELGIETHLTSERIKAELDEMKVAWTGGWCRDSSGGGGAGVVADIGNGKGRLVLIRADMDGLPIQEETGLPFASEVPGVMHACGHDSHTAVLLGVARLLKERESEIDGVIRLMFQPGEEMVGGAKLMVAEGVLEKAGQTVGSAFSMHVMPYLPTNCFLLQEGTLLASGTHFTAKITGKGGHAGVPALSRDVLTASSALITMSQCLSSRETFGISTLSHGLVSFTQIRSDGVACNSLPDTVTLKGTVRGGSIAVARFLMGRMEDLGKSMELSHRVSVEFEWELLFPPLVNDCELARRYLPLVESASLMRLPRRNKDELMYAMEDFAFVSDRVPAITVVLGVANVRSAEDMANFSLDTACTLHNSKFTLEEDFMPRSTALFAQLALTELSRLNAD